MIIPAVRKFGRHWYGGVTSGKNGWFRTRLCDSPRTSWIAAAADALQVWWGEYSKKYGLRLVDVILLLSALALGLAVMFRG